MTILNELPSFLSEAISRFGVPGASLAVLADSSVHTAAAGVINTETQVETTTDSVFQIGSITKLLTTVMTLQLVEEGKLSLDQSIRNVLKDFSVGDPDVSAAVTPRHFLNHSSGVDGDFFVDSGRGADKVARLLEMGRSLSQLHELGKGFSYCNFGFAVMGRIQELADGAEWGTVMRERIAKRLQTEFLTTEPEALLRRRAAIGHLPGGPSGELIPSRQPYLPFGLGPAGTTPTCRAQDLIAFAQTFLDGRGTLVSNQSIELMRTPNTPTVNANAVSHFGLGFMLFDWNGVQLFGHDGATIGQNSFLRIHDSGVAVALLTNGGDVQGLAHEVMTTVFGELAGFSPPLQREGMRSAIDTSRYIGTYHRGLTSFTVEADGENLTLTSGPGDEWSMGLVPKAGPFVLSPVDSETFTYRIPGMALPTTIQFVGAKNSGTFDALHIGMRHNPLRR